MSKYEVYRLDDNYYFPSNDIIFTPYGVWINDSLTPTEGEHQIKGLYLIQILDKYWKILRRT